MSLHSQPVVVCVPWGTILIVRSRRNVNNAVSGNIRSKWDRYNEGGGASVCEKCMPGTFFEAPVSYECVPCSPGEYQEESGQLLCKQ